jgi:CopG family transcriptional regulator, nickel-responsive regulator
MEEWAMERITITIDDELLVAIDAFMERKGYTSRSEAFRDAMRSVLDREAAGSDGNCVAALSYVYDHATRHLADRLTDSYHQQHDLTVANLHVHLDREACLEVAVLRGSVNEVTAFADTVSAQRGVRHTNLHVMPDDHCGVQPAQSGRTGHHRHA